MLACVISVCLYPHILSSCLPGGAGMNTAPNEHLMTTGVILVIATIGLTKGLGDPGMLEQRALPITCLIIGLLLLGFAHCDRGAAQSPLGDTA